MDIQSLYSEYCRWVSGKRDRCRTVNSVWPSGTRFLLPVTVTPPTTAASRIGQPQPQPQPQPAPSSDRPQSTVPLDPEIREFRRNEDSFDYRRFSMYASETSKQGGAPKPENSAPLSRYRQKYRGQWGKPATSTRPPDHLKVSACPFVSTTEYQDQYRGWQVPPGYDRRDTDFRPAPRMDLQTSYAQDYRGLQGDVTAPARPRDNLTLGASPFEVPAEYQREWLVPPPQRYKTEYVRPKGKIEFSTSYRQDFKAKERSVRFPIMPRDQICMPKGAFLDETTYNSDYQARRAWGL